MKKILCIGGLNDGKKLTYDEVGECYIQFNCSCGSRISKRKKEILKAQGKPIVESSVFIHASFFVEKIMQDYGNLDYNGSLV